MSGHDPLFFENLLIKYLYTDEDVRERVMPFLTTDVFEEKLNIDIVQHAMSFEEKYDKFPTLKESKLSIPNSEMYNHLKDVIGLDTSEYENEFLLEEIELFLKKKLIWNLSVDIAQNVSENTLDSSGDMPDKLRDAYAFSFDTTVGLNMFNEEDRLYDFFHEKKYVVPTGLKHFDRMIDGGFHDKSLSLFLAETNMGKSLIMASLAVANVLQNKNVLYISCELSEDKTAERVLANMFDMPIDQIRFLTKDKFHQKYEKLNTSFHDKFVIKEYPSKSINTNAIRNLLKELKLKLKFEPDIIYLDQIENLNSIYRTKNDNSYNEMKRVTNEVRGLASEVGIPIVSAIQTNRDGFGSAEIDLDNTGESIGFVQIADVVIGITQSEELRAAGKYSWRLLKNRYGINKRKITIGVDYEKMRVYDDPDFEDGESIGAPPPPSTAEKEKTKGEAVEAVQGVLNRNKKKRDNKVIEFE